MEVVLSPEPSTTILVKIWVFSLKMQLFVRENLGSRSAEITELYKAILDNFVQSSGLAKSVNCRNLVPKDKSKNVLCLPFNMKWWVATQMEFSISFSPPGFKAGGKPNLRCVVVFRGNLMAQYATSGMKNNVFFIFNQPFSGSSQAYQFRTNSLTIIYQTPSNCLHHKLC